MPAAPSDSVDPMDPASRPTPATDPDSLASSLLAPGFDPAAWINARLAAPSLDQARSLSLELSALSHSTALRLERLFADSLATLSHTATDINAIQREADLLAETLANATRIHHPDSNPPSDPDAFFQDPSSFDAHFSEIALLDVVLDRMEATRVCIKEAENWNTLAAEMDAILASGDFDKAAARLAEARRSLGLLAASSSFDDRRALFDRLCADLLALIRPQLSSALAARNIAAASRFRAIFVQLGEAAEFGRQYAQARCDPILRIWSAHHKGAAPNTPKASSNTPIRLPIAEEPAWLQSFFGHILALATEEAATPFVLPSDYNPDRTTTNNTTDTHSVNSDLTAILDFIFENLDPVFTAWLHSVFDPHPSRGTTSMLPTLCSIYTITCEFVQKIELLMGHTISPTQSPSSWHKAVFDGFLHYQGNYYELERMYLMTLLPPARDPVDVGSISVMLSECNTKAVATCESALTRCNQLTFGLGVTAAAQAMDDYLVALCNALMHVLGFLQTPAGTAVLVSAFSASSSLSSLSSFGQTVMDPMDAVPMSEDSRADFRAAVQVHNSVVAFVSRCGSLSATVVASHGPSKNVSSGQSLMVSLGSPVDGRMGGDSIASPAYAFLLSAMADKRLVFSNAPANHSSQVSSSSSLIKANSVSALNLTATASQRLVFECLFQRVARHLDDLHKYPVWAEASTSSTTATNNNNSLSIPHEQDLPQFSLSPLPYIVHIGEQLLELPQHIDVFSSDVGMQYSLRTLPFLEPMDMDVVHEGTAKTGSRDEEGEDKDDDDDKDEDDDVTHLWISSVSRAIEVRWMDQITRIPKLTGHGVKQLLTDAEYFTNILAAMMIDVQPRVAEMRRVLGMDEKQLAACVSGGEGENGRVSDVVVKIAAMRGVVVA